MKVQAVLPRRMRNLRRETTERRNETREPRSEINEWRARIGPPSRRARTFINVPAASYNSANDVFLRVPLKSSRDTSVTCPRAPSPSPSRRRVIPDGGLGSFSRTRADAFSLSHRRGLGDHDVTETRSFTVPPLPACPIGGIGLILVADLCAGFPFSPLSLVA